MSNSNSKWVLPSIAAVLVLCLACTCCGVAGLYFLGDQIVAGLRGPQEVPSTSIPSSNIQVTATPVSEPAAQLPEWTMIVYSAADDEVLEETMWFDVNEMELVGSTPQLNIVVQIDRYAAGFSGDGDITDTRRYLVSQDNDLSTIASPVIENLGEVDMSDPQTLVDFVTSLGAKPQKTRVIPNKVDLALFGQKHLGSHEKPFTFLTIGRLVRSTPKSTDLRGFKVAAS